jgi:hypothetical protein
MPYFSPRVDLLLHKEKCSIQNRRCPRMDAKPGVLEEGVEPKLTVK